MKNVKTQLQTFKAGYVGDERTPLTLTGNEPEESKQNCCTGNERTPMPPAGQELEQKQPLKNKNEREPMFPVTPDNERR